MELGDIPLSRSRWRNAARLIPSRYPPIQLFEEVADPGDLEAVFYIEGLTNPRLREEVGEISLIPPEDRVSGPGTSAIMAAFTHLNPFGSRFTNGSYGIYYCARTLETAIAETRFQRERFLRDAALPATIIEMRVYYADILKALHDIRGRRSTEPALYHPDDYSVSQSFGQKLRLARSFGLYYDSVRHAGGECAAVFRPQALSPAHQGEHFGYRWNGAVIDTVFRLESVV
jgi:hypothetical protein